MDAKDCVKDKISGNYTIQLVEIDTKDKQPIQPKINHYQYMKQKVKSGKDKTKNKTFKQNGMKKRTLKKNEQHHLVFRNITKDIRLRSVKSFGKNLTVNNQL